MLEFEGMNFGEIVQKLRKDKDWTIKEFIKMLDSKGNKTISPAYVTRIEQYDEIPSPDVICIIADVFRVDPEILIERAKEEKIKKFDKNLEEKYQKAVGLYRTQRDKK